MAGKPQNKWARDLMALHDLVSHPPPEIVVICRDIIRREGWVRRDSVSPPKAAPGRPSSKPPNPEPEGPPGPPPLVRFDVPADGISRELIERNAGACGLPPDTFLKQLLLVALLQRSERLNFFPKPAGHPRHGKGPADTSPLRPELAKGLGRI